MVAVGAGVALFLSVQSIRGADHSNAVTSTVGYGVTVVGIGIALVLLGGLVLRQRSVATSPAGIPTRTSAGLANGWAVASLTLGVLWLFGLGSIAALVFGFVGLRQIDRVEGKGRRLAIAGIVLGWIGLAGLVVLIVVGRTRH